MTFLISSFAAAFSANFASSVLLGLWLPHLWQSLTCGKFVAPQPLQVHFTGFFFFALFSAFTCFGFSCSVDFSVPSVASSAASVPSASSLSASASDVASSFALHITLASERSANAAAMPVLPSSKPLSHAPANEDGGKL
eukprot:CAMPEP_0172863426 /NCGR_PEP_ID=MMETSP1075-20121228/77255_1 /TAXON_ID=2916 /ORGANISM="Ceratium fusus, Strain PA161109" /LENGTH=138 /DNA_ID=CAMNT_0013712029 /DNA_START=38 /DNA_END=449 /DNA_ORIENTATION=+